MSSNNKSSGGIGLLGVLQIVFVVLKLCGLINWSWGLVLIPLWIMLVEIVILVVIAIYTHHYFKKYDPRNNERWWK